MTPEQKIVSDYYYSLKAQVEKVPQSSEDYAKMRKDLDTIKRTFVVEPPETLKPSLTSLE